jgi:hypothetical protein
VVRTNPTQYHRTVDDPTQSDRSAADPAANDRAIRMIER